MFIPERIRSSIADADLLAGPIVQMIFVLRTVFMLANHYTASDKGRGMLTTGGLVFDNLHGITGLGVVGRLFRKRTAYCKPSSERCRTLGLIHAPAGGFGAGRLVQGNLAGSKLQAVRT
jgi:hypothetical protein